MENILVTGATGNLGTLTIDFLIGSGVSSENIHALVRDKSKAADLEAKGVILKKGSYDDYESLVKAFKGIDKLLFISGSEIANREKQHENVVNAAKKAGVNHILYTSFMRKNETESSPIAMVSASHLKTEAWIKASGLTYTILKNTLYMDMLPIFMGEKVIETGTIYLPAGNGKVAYLTRNDMAEIAAHILTTSGHENQDYDVTADQSYSYDQIAEILSGIVGKNIQYVSPSVEEFTKTMKGAGVPEEYIGLFAGFSAATAQGEFEQTGTIVEDMLNRKPTSMTDFLKEVYRK